MKRLGWVMGLCVGYSAVSAADLGAQAVSAAAFPGLQLKVAESALDLSTPASVALHLQIVNSSDHAVSIWPGTASLVGLDKAGVGSRCDNPPNTSVRPDSAAKTLRPGDTYAESLTLNTDVCKGLLQARSIQVERVVSAAAEDRITLQSPPVPVQNRRSDADSIRAMLSQQAADWNRGDLPAFASGYKNSPDILFIGRTVNRGYEGMLAAYQQGYATRDAMGTLTFSELEVQPLDAAFATVTGHFHLQRTAAGGGNSDGYFLLVVQNTADGWKIVRDDTTATPATPAAPAAH